MPHEGEKNIFADLDRCIDEYLPQMERDICALIACPSVGSAAVGPSKPFGAAVASAIEKALEIASSLGMTTHPGDGYMAWADLTFSPDGSNDNNNTAAVPEVGILAHVDVVPADAGEWEYDPFSPVVTEDRIYGRGALDDKGPLIAAMYAAYALKQAGIKLNKKIRFLIGGDEESGCRCLEYYRQHHPLPQWGFSPDAEFPLIIGEKGICQFRLIAPLPADKGSGIKLTEAHCGKAVNILPGRAEAKINDVDIHNLPAAEGISLMNEGENIRIIATGKAAHGSMPQEGKNALTLLIRYLARLPLAENAAAWVKIAASLMEDDSFGTSTGMAAEDEVSCLTQIPSMLAIENGRAVISWDTRFPVTHRKERYIEAAHALAAKYGWQAEILATADPMYVPEDAPIAALLLEAYREYTGDMRLPLVIGGGTYAKGLEGFLAFGPEFAHTPKLCHQANEYISKKDLLDAAKIYARAIWRLAK